MVQDRVVSPRWQAYAWPQWRQRCEGRNAMALRHRLRSIPATLALAVALCAPCVIASAQDGIDFITKFPRDPIKVAAWPGGKKVAVSFALFVETFGFGQGPIFRPDLASR